MFKALIAALLLTSGSLGWPASAMAASEADDGGDPPAHPSELAERITACWQLRDMVYEDGTKVPWSRNRHFQQSLIDRELIEFAADGSWRKWTIYRDEVGLPPHVWKAQWRLDDDRLHVPDWLGAMRIVSCEDDELVLSKYGYHRRYRKLRKRPELAAAPLTGEGLQGRWRIVEASGPMVDEQVEREDKADGELPDFLKECTLSFDGDGRGSDGGTLEKEMDFHIEDGVLRLTYQYVASASATTRVRSEVRGEGGRRELEREVEKTVEMAERTVDVPARVANDALTLLLPDPPTLLRFERIDPVEADARSPAAD